MNTLLLIGIFGLFGGSSKASKPTPTPIPSPTIEALAIATPRPDMTLLFCRQVVNSIPEVCDAPDAELGNCLSVVDQICPNRKRK